MNGGGLGVREQEHDVGSEGEHHPVPERVRRID